MKQPNTNIEKEILDAAEKLFQEKGYALTSTTEIAKTVGCNQAMVHYYFRTKDNLFEQIFERKIKLFASTFFHPSVTNMPFEELLRTRIEAHFDLLSNNPKLPFLLINEITTNPNRIESLSQKIGAIPTGVVTILQQLIDKEVANGRIRPIRSLDLFITVISLNVASFISLPILKKVLNMDAEGEQKFIAQRKKEICDTILLSLRPLQQHKES